jgi:hypothetical protein
MFYSHLLRSAPVLQWLLMRVNGCAVGPVSHIQWVASGQRKGQFLLRYAQLKSVNTVQCNFRLISIFRFDLLWNRWIGRAWSVAWPPRTASLAPLDLFSWAICETHCLWCKNSWLGPPTTENHCSSSKITPDMLYRTRTETENLLDVCTIADGAHIKTSQDVSLNSESFYIFS